jgi:hypothetical protein
VFKILGDGRTVRIVDQEDMAIEFLSATSDT